MLNKHKRRGKLLNDGKHFHLMPKREQRIRAETRIAPPAVLARATRRHITSPNLKIFNRQSLQGIYWKWVYWGRNAHHLKGEMDIRIYLHKEQEIFMVGKEFENLKRPFILQTNLPPEEWPSRTRRSGSDFANVAEIHVKLNGRKLYRKYLCVPKARLG